MPIGAVREARVPSFHPAEPAPAGEERSGRTSSHDAPLPFASLLRHVELRVDQGEATLRDAIAANRAGRDVSLPELIAIQSGVYRYSETVDLLARLVDHTTTGMKTVLQGQ
jgi:hypothetical protein